MFKQRGAICVCDENYLEKQTAVLIEYKRRAFPGIFGRQYSPFVGALGLRNAGHGAFTVHHPVSTGGESHQARERRLGVRGAACLSCLEPLTDPGTYSTLKRCAACADLMAVALREAEDLIAKIK